MPTWAVAMAIDQGEAKMSSRPSYYTPSEVAAHNSETDCWVSYLGKVYDLTQFCKEHSG